MTDLQAKATVEFMRRVIRGRLDVERLTYREIAATSGVCAPTVCRFLKGRAIDAITFLKFCDWIKP